jgi:hypothetical protein
VEDVCASLKGMFLLAWPLMTFAEQVRIDVLYLILSNSSTWTSPTVSETVQLNKNKCLFLSKASMKFISNLYPTFP